MSGHFAIANFIGLCLTLLLSNHQAIEEGTVVTSPPETDPSRMRGFVEKEAKNAKRKKIHTRTNHHQIAGSRGAAKPGDELLDREIFYSLREEQVLIEMWSKHYNMVRPHNTLGYRPPAPVTIVVQPSQIPQAGLRL